MNRFILIILLAVLSLPASASTEQLWQRGNEFYRQKQYDSAVACFNRVQEEIPENAAVYYNLGNAYYRLNNIGMAVLNYQRALNIDPDYKAASDNLLLAESRISNYIQEVPDLFFVQWWHTLTSGANANLLGIVSLCLFLLLLGLILLRWLKNPAWFRPQFVGGLIALWAVSLLLAFVSAGNAGMKDHAVVMENDAPMVNAPQQTKVQSYIPEGSTVQILDQKAGYTEVRLADGRRGWMKQEYLAEI